MLFWVNHTQALFHIMPEQAGDSAALRYACVLAANCYRQQQKVFIFTDNQQQAHYVDELLWSFEPDSFVPHNLVGEGPKYGRAPIHLPRTIIIIYYVILLFALATPPKP